MPRGHSLRARLCIIEMQPGDMDWSQLTICQHDAANGLYALAMAGYLRWLAEHYAESDTRRAADVMQLRDLATAADGGAHRRTPEVTANLALGLRTFLDYAKACNALDQTARTRSGSAGGKPWRRLRHTRPANRPKASQLSDSST